MIGKKTLLQYVMDSEFEEFRRINAITYESIQNPLSTRDGSFIMEINSSGQAFSDTMGTDYLDDISTYSRRSPGDYQHQLGEKIIKIPGPMPYSEALQLTYDTKKLIGEKFAGVIFEIEKDALINPLHPLVALSTLEVSINVYKIYMFTYKDLDSINENYNSYSKTSTEFYPSIANLMKMYQSQVSERGVKILSNSIDIENMSLYQEYQVSKHKGEAVDKEYYLAAHQLLTKGTFVPYYGTSIVSMNGSTSGFHITPFKSCNINGHSSSGPSSVCTGSTPNTTIKGLRTLHHANLGSPYERECMTDSSKPYADACIEQSINVYKLANLIKEESEDDSDV